MTTGDYDSKLEKLYQMWWCMPITTAFGELRQEDCESKASLGYVVTPCLKTARQGYLYSGFYIYSTSLLDFRFPNCGAVFHS